jgi:uncharacterized protein involved in outer membrane biogenesis
MRRRNFPGADAAMSRFPRLSRSLARAAIVAAALLAVVLLAMVLLLDPSAHQARIEAAASRVLGMEVSVGGPLALRWRPGAHLVLGDVRARKHGADILTARQAVLGIELRSLIGGDVRVHSVALQDGTFAIVRGRDGRFNFQKDTPPDAPRPARDLPDVSFERATITYADARSERRIEARGCRGDLRRVHTAGGPRRLLAGLSFEGDAACAEVRSGGIALVDARTSARATAGVIEFQPLSVRLFDVTSNGRARADFSGALPAYRIEQTLQQFPIEQLLKALSLREVASGRMNLTARLAMQGHGAQALQRSMQGTVSLRGQGLVYHGADLDARFARFESSQSLNLFDVGALLLAGPAGLLVTKGYELASAAQEVQGKSEIRTLVSDWVIERGVARAQDVALATPANRVALKGNIDLVDDRFEGMTIALVDPKGCAKVRQPVRGALGKPVLDRPNPIEVIAGPAVRLLKKGAELAGAECEVFYAGAVPAPQ